MIKIQPCINCLIKNERVFFSRYQYTVNAPVLSDIEGSGPREKAYIL